MTNNHDRYFAQARSAPNNRRIVTEQSISVQFYEIREDIAYVVECEGAVEVPRKLHALIRRELTVDLLSKLGDLRLKGSVLVAPRQIAACKLIFEPLELIFKLNQWALEL
jgi:hypothetical protein